MNGTAASLITLAVAVVALVAGAPRWLRLAQREHYLPGSTSRFALRWWGLPPLNPLLAAVAVAGVAVGAAVTPIILLGAAAATVGPVGLSWRGRTSRLEWTARCKTLTVTASVVAAVVIGGAAIAGLRPAAGAAGALVVLTPGLVDLALLLNLPLESRRLAPYLARATTKLNQVAPKVVAITGSYGKTTTKGYVTHLLSGSKVVYPSPRSFNNRAGLARAINDGLAPGAEVFVAEMGTYGPGEIAELCRWIPPDVAVITAIGPVHLERMGSEERIAQAKAEILERAPVVVLNVDHPLLAALADQAQHQGKAVWRCSASSQAPPAGQPSDGSDPSVRTVVFRPDDLGGWLELDGASFQVEGLFAPPTNVACAVSVALSLGIPLDVVLRRLPGLPSAEHRQSVVSGSQGQTIIDDTFNANPAGASAAIATLHRLGSSSARRVLVTPGMVELGNRQAEANQQMVADAAELLTHLVVVGATNASALAAGAAGTSIEVIRVRHRPEAVAWVSEHTGAGDVVLYENDLPDHFP